MTERPLRIHGAEPHLRGGEELLEIAITDIACVATPLSLGTLVAVFLRLLNIEAAATAAEGCKTYRLERAVTARQLATRC